MPTHSLPPALLTTATLAAALPLLASAAGPGAVCEAQAGAAAPTVVELYTSEGCSSCPPADRWLSTLKPQPGVIALAFHVDYWDRLGWPDRFASPAYTQRQQQWQQRTGARFVYTPQVLRSGADWRGWSSGQSPSRVVDAATAPRLSLRRDGDQVTADLGATAGAAAATRYSGFWAVVEDGFESQVKSGENQGSLLHHDHVVRRYVPVAPWPAHQARSFSFTAPATTPGHPQRVVFVVEAAEHGQPVQALSLSCPPA
jgi:hypothetical protein